MASRGSSASRGDYYCGTPDNKDFRITTDAIPVIPVIGSSAVAVAVVVAVARSLRHHHQPRFAAKLVGHLRQVGRGPPLASVDAHGHPLRPRWQVHLQLPGIEHPLHLHGLPATEAPIRFHTG